MSAAIYDPFPFNTQTACGVIRREVSLGWFLQVAQARIIGSAWVCPHSFWHSAGVVQLIRHISTLSLSLSLSLYLACIYEVCTEVESLSATLRSRVRLRARRRVGGAPGRVITHLNTINQTDMKENRKQKRKKRFLAALGRPLIHAASCC